MSCQRTATHVEGLLVGIQDASYRPRPQGSLYGSCRNESQEGAEVIGDKAKLTYNIYYTTPANL